jgi:citrate synthase
MKILLEIGDVGRVEGYVSGACEKEKIMGHAVYKTEDPRATHLRRFSKEMGERKGDSKWYEITAKLEAIMKREKNLLPNVDAYSASTYYMMGIPLDLYTPIFAISRISGWTAHILEQYDKLIRPRAEYVGRATCLTCRLMKVTEYGRPARDSQRCACHTDPAKIAPTLPFWRTH